MNHMISLAAAITLTEWSKRTLWRRISDGTLTRGDDHSLDDKAKIGLDAIKAHICIPLADDDYALIASADKGNAEAQTDLALLFLAHAKPASAIYWLELAAKREYANAMYLLGRCYTDGNGLPHNDNLGIMWIARAAALGHVISLAQMDAMRSSFTSQR